MGIFGISWIAWRVLCGMHGVSCFTHVTGTCEGDGGNPDGLQFLVPAETLRI